MGGKLKDYCMNALKKTVLDIRWMLLIAILGPVGSFLVSRDVQTIIPVLLVEVVVAFPIALVIDYLIHLLLCYYGKKNNQQVGRNEKY